MTQPEHKPATSPSDALNEMGRAHSIPRKDSESDALYAERMVYELDVRVEQLWAVQDEIRALISPE